MKRKPKRTVAPVDVSSLVPLPAAAQVADVTEAWLRRLVAAGKVRGVRIGKFWLVDVESARAFQRHPTAGRPRATTKEKKS